MSMLWPQRALEERLPLEGCQLPRLWKAWALGAGLQDCTDSSRAEAGRCSCKVLCRSRGTSLARQVLAMLGPQVQHVDVRRCVKEVHSVQEAGVEGVEPTGDTAKKEDHSRLKQPKAMEEVCGRLLGGPGDADGDASMIAEYPLPQVVVQHNFGEAKVDNANCTDGGDEGTSGGNQGHEGEAVQDSEGRSGEPAPTGLEAADGRQDTSPGAVSEGRCGLRVEGGSICGGGSCQSEASEWTSFSNQRRSMH